MYKPWLLLARITDRCNANCRYCIRKYYTTHPDMSFDLYKQIIDLTEDYIKEVQPIGFGEPILYPHLVDAVKYASEIGKRVVTYTNASLLTPDLSLRLLDAGLSEIRFSIEAMDAPVFEALRRPLSFDVVLFNILTFQAIKEDHGFKCKTTVAACKSPENEHQLAEIQSFWEQRVDHIFFRPEQVFAIPCMCPDLYVTGRSFNCKHLYEYLSVDWDGNVVICCRDMFSQYVFGNIQYDDPLTIFNNQHMNDLRQAMRDGEHYPTICDYCGVSSKRSKGGEQLEWLNL